MNSQRNKEKSPLAVTSSLRPVDASAKSVSPDQSDNAPARRVPLAVEPLLQTQTQWALRESEMRYREFFENAKDAIYIHDLSGRYMLVNHAGEQLIGYTKEEILRLSVFDVIRYEDLNQIRGKLNQKLADHAATVYEVEVVTKHGRRVPVEVSSRLIYENGVPIGVQGTAREITERRERQKALKASEERLRELIENANDIIFTCDMSGNINSLNRAGQKLIGYLAREAVGMNFAHFVAPEFLETAAEMLARQTTSDASTVYELEIITRCGERAALEVSSQTIFSEGKAVGVQGVARDITERKRTEQALRASQLQLQQSQKLEAVGQLAGGVAHDFNNLLTAIIGYSQLSLRRLDSEDPVARNINEIMKAAGRAASLTRQLLAFSRKQILEAKVLDLNLVVNDMSQMLRRLISEDVELSTIAATDLDKVKADCGQIEQIIMNLAVNARDAMPSGGKLTIETANVVLDDEYAQQNLPTEPGAYVMLSVSDTGVGMDQQTLSRIFEPFFTTKAIGKGTGLGLSTVYGIVKQSGGYIWASSELGRGTTFRVYLPRVDALTVKEKLRLVSPPAPRGSETILLVEDDEQVREIVRQILERQGYRTITAPNGEQALAVAHRHIGRIHLTITDVVMPQMNGRELAERLAHSRPDMKILYMSGYTDDATMRLGLLDKQFQFIQKPFAADALASKVRDTLDAPA